MESHVKIFLDSVEVPLKIGIYDHEQNVPQRVVVDVELYADHKTYLREVDKDSIIDYAVVYNAITSWAERPQVQLIEDYLKELMDLCFKFDAVTAARVAINKADVFGPKQGAGVELMLTRGDFNQSEGSSS